MAAISTRQKALAAVVLLTLAVFILGLSLQSSNTGFSPALYPSSTQRPLAKLMSHEMVPGNPMYTLLMVKDRVVLEFTFDPIENAWLRVEYANRRLEYAQTLLENKEEVLAITTMAKAQIYLGQAVELVQKHDAGQLEKLRAILLEHQVALRTTKELLTDSDKARIDQLIGYNASLVQTISRH